MIAPTRRVIAVKAARLLLASLGLMLLAGGCSGDKPAQYESKASSVQALDKDCANPQWKQQNLGLWYSVCRRPLTW